MASVSRQVTSDAQAEEMWARVGGFDNPDSWHPVIASTTVSDDGSRRELTTVDGAKINETLLDRGDSSYSYRIDDSPLPVRDYRATISVESRDGGCAVSWAAEFEPDGVSEEEAQGIIEGIFDAGLQAL